MTMRSYDYVQPKDAKGQPYPDVYTRYQQDTGCDSWQNQYLRATPDSSPSFWLETKK